MFSSRAGDGRGNCPNAGWCVKTLVMAELRVRLEGRGGSGMGWDGYDAITMGHRLCSSASRVQSFQSKLKMQTGYTAS